MKTLQAMKIGILGASPETPNLGVGALAVGAVGCLLCAYPDAALFFLDYGKRRRLHRLPAGPLWIRVPLLNIRFSWKIWLSNNIAFLLCMAALLRLIPSQRMRDALARRNVCLREISCTDMFASVAGGDSFSDIYGLVRFIYVALPQLLILLLGKPLVLLPQTYGPFRRRLPRRIAQWIVSHAERAWCRDHVSLAELMGPARGDRTRKTTPFCYDMAFALDSVPPPHLAIDGLSLPAGRNPHLIGINISGLLFQGGYTGNNEFGLCSDYRELVFATVELLLAQPSAIVLLVPHVFGNEAESDAVACSQVFAELQIRYPGRIALLRGTLNANEIRYVIGHCGFFVGSRMHACIAAISQNIPTVAIAYSDKFLGVMNSIGIEAMVADARQLSREEILGTIRQALRNRERITGQLARTIPHIRETVRNLLVPSYEEMTVR